MADVLTSEQRSFNMSRIRGKNTLPELLVRKLVHRLGFRYRLHGTRLPGKPDLVFARLKKVIFVHGCYWHIHDCSYGRVKPKTNAEFWETKRRSNVDRDRRNLKNLVASGWEPLVVWECETRNAKALERRVVRFLR